MTIMSRSVAVTGDCVALTAELTIKDVMNWTMT